MNTRKFIHCLSAVSALLFAAAVHADEFSMASGNLLAQTGSMNLASTGDRDSSPDPVTVNGDLGGSRFMHGSSRDSMPSGISDGRTSASDNSDDEPATSVRASNAPVNVNGTRATIPNATPATPAKSRSSNRWQSLVPGAIK
jgi:hypothetical protein